MPKSLPTRLSAALLCAAAAAGVLAQESPPEGPLLLAQTERERAFSFRFNGEEAPVFAGGEAAAERVVKGAPYCAEAVHETVQWLQDNGSGAAPNRIVRQNSTRLCRDGEGRTRQEVERGGRKVVYLRDPVARESWLLDTERKSARRLAGGGAAMDAVADSAAWREYAERMRVWARSMADRVRPSSGATSATPPTPPAPPTPPTSPTPPTPVVITRADGAAADVEVNVVRLHGSGQGSAPVEWALPPPAVQWRAQTLAPRGAGSVSPLGSKEMDGVRANGERTTWVIEAGKLGNEKPIQISRETWTSPDLMVTLSSRDFDPRTGELNYRLKNLKRGEPDAALMRVPAEFNKSGRPATKASGPTG